MTAEHDGAELFAVTHHSLRVKPWVALPGGVAVYQADDIDDEQPVLLLRDADEVEHLADVLRSVQLRSENRR